MTVIKIPQELATDLQHSINREQSRQYFLLECLSDKHKSKISKKELNDELLVVIGRLEAYRHALELVEALQK